MYRVISSTSPNRAVLTLLLDRLPYLGTVNTSRAASTATSTATAPTSSTSPKSNIEPISIPSSSRKSVPAAVESVRQASHRIKANRPGRAHRRSTSVQRHLITDKAQKSQELDLAKASNRLEYDKALIAPTLGIPITGRENITHWALGYKEREDSIKTIQRVMRDTNLQQSIQEMKMEKEEEKEKGGFMSLAGLLGQEFQSSGSASNRSVENNECRSAFSASASASTSASEQLSRRAIRRKARLEKFLADQQQANGDFTGEEEPRKPFIREEPPHKGLIEEDTPWELPAKNVEEEVIEDITRPSRWNTKPRAKDILEEGNLTARDVDVDEVQPLREMKIAKLHPQLPRVLFSPGVHPMRDPRTGIWNFRPALNKIPTPQEFAFERTPGYVTPSQDSELAILAKRENCSFIGSTSTLTSSLSQIYFALSGGKGVDLNTLSREFYHERDDFTAGASLPAAIVITRLDNGILAVDGDKSYDTDNILSDYGRILEKLLTTNEDEFSAYLKESPLTPKVKEEMKEKEAYRYRKSGSILMRSQLDCHDPRLPGTGVFDIKTRACLPIRHDRANYEANSVYDISKDLGWKFSFEREMYDLIRAGMLKYSLQVRIGDMDGIFLAYHNTKRIFGFQYLPLSDLDERLFGSVEMGDQAFRLSISLLEKLLNHIIADQSPEHNKWSLTLKASGGNKMNEVSAFVMPINPVAEQSSEATQITKEEGDVVTEEEGNKSSELAVPEKGPVSEYVLSIENFLDGTPISGIFELDQDDQVRKLQEWTVKYSISKYQPNLESGDSLRRILRPLASMNYLNVPEGKTVAEITSLTSAAKTSEITPGSAPKKQGVTKWKNPDPRVVEMRAEARASGEAYDRKVLEWDMKAKEMKANGMRGMRLAWTVVR